jgi:hypothetical protein
LPQARTGAQARAPGRRRVPVACAVRCARRVARLLVGRDLAVAVAVPSALAQRHGADAHARGRGGDAQLLGVATHSKRRGGRGRTLRGVEAPKRRTEEKPRHAGYLTRCPWRLHPNRTPSPTSTHATAAPRPPPQIPPLASAFARRVGSASVVGTGATSWAAGCGLARRGAGACCQQTILCNLQHESRRGAPAALTSSANAPGYWGRHGGAGAGVARRR